MTLGQNTWAKQVYKTFPYLLTKKFREILRYFSLDETANKTSVYTNISRNTINKIFDKIRQKIFLALTIFLPHNSFILGQEEKSQKKSLFTEFELDESYFGAKSS
jgi:hypothetical protein